MIINTDSVVGYNNNLTKATDGVNHQVNLGTKKASLKLMAGGPSKVNSHPANPIHKQTTEAQGLAKTQTPVKSAPATQTQTQIQSTTKTESVDSHHVNKTLAVVGALALVGVIVYVAS